MSKSNTFENDLLKLIFQGVAIAGLADNAAVGALTQLYMSLHTADPGEAGDQTTNEVAYTGYARVAIVRSALGWNVVGNTVTPVSSVDFGEMTAGTPGEATHGVIGTAASGAGKVLYRGALTPSIPYAVGTIPRLRNTSTIQED
jgi:hypothetical protein